MGDFNRAPGIRVRADRLDFSQKAWRRKLVADLTARIVEKVSYVAELNPPRGDPRPPYTGRLHTPPYQLERRWSANGRQRGVAARLMSEALRLARYRAAPLTTKSADRSPQP